MFKYVEKSLQIVDNSTYQRPFICKMSEARENYDLQGKKKFTNAVDVARKAFTDKVPQAIEIEQAVLGALMLERDALVQVVDILNQECFYDQKNQETYLAILRLFQKNEAIDILTVFNQLKQAQKEKIVTLAYLTTLISKVSSAVNIEFHARILQEKAIRRNLRFASDKVSIDSVDETKDVFGVLDEAEQALYQISETNFKKGYQGINDILKEAIKQLEEKKTNDTDITGVPSGFSALDRVTAGWQKSELIILAARPGMGKTAFVVSCARNAAVHFKKGVVIFSLEMSAVQLVNRIISAEAELDSDKLRKGNLEEYEWAQLNHKITALTDAPLFIDDTPALSILELRAKCRRLKAQHDIQMIIVDYLQLMTGDLSRNGVNREQEIASISRALKNLAKELDVPVIALSQLSRDVEKRTGGKKPQLSDLRESGSLEQDADMVIFLYRPDYYGIETDEEGQNLKGLGEVIIAKNRSGSTTQVYLKFIGKYTKFVSLDDEPFVGRGFGSAMPAVDSNAALSSFESGAPNTITLGSKMNQDRGLPTNTNFDDIPF